MTLVIALHRITKSDSAEPLIHSGEFDAAGNAILKKQVFSILPGTFFEIDDESELAELLAAGAVRYPDEAELALYERGIVQPIAVRPSMREIAK